MELPPAEEPIHPALGSPDPASLLQETTLQQFTGLECLLLCAALYSSESVTCRSVLPVYAGHRWYFIEEHIHDVLGKQDLER